MADAKQKAKKSKKQRKLGRNAVYCQYYAATNRREKNKIKTLNKHLARFPDDKVALKALELCKLVVRGF
jgi:hypothetical protein